MPRLRSLIVVGVIVLLIGGALLANVVLARARARARADSLEGKNLTLAPVVKGLNEPTLVAWPPDGSKRLFVLERAGRVRVADADGQLKPTPFLDVTDDTSTG